jgi:hypothetical protein
MSRGTPPREALRWIGLSRGARFCTWVQILLLVLAACSFAGLGTWLPFLAISARDGEQTLILSSCSSIPCLDDARVCVEIALNESLRCGEALYNRTLKCKADAAPLISQCDSARFREWFEVGKWSYYAIFWPLNLALALCIRKFVTHAIGLYGELRKDWEPVPVHDTSESAGLIGERTAGPD